MKIEIKKILLQEGIGQHLKNNWKKYAAGATGIGTLKAASNGYLGVDAQDAIQNFAGENAWDLENKARYNNINSSLNAAKQVFSKPDNILTNWDNNENTYKIQKVLQPGTWSSVAQNGLAKGIRGVTSMGQSPDKENFIVRNPFDSASLGIQSGTAYVKPFLGLDN